MARATPKSTRSSPRKSTSVQSSAKKSKALPKKKRQDTSEEEYDEEAEESGDSDALDDESEPEQLSRKRKATSRKKTLSPRKRRKTDYNDESDEEEEFHLEKGQRIVGTVVQAPKTGQVPAGQISKNTFDFLKLLAEPENNDRKWFKLREPVFRQAEKEWKDFIDEFLPLLIEADPQIPHLPARDLVHRIYNDIRFKTDKTPYKTGFSASTSRSGRKGHFAHFKPGNRSIIAGGAWQPERQDLQNIRTSILRSSARFRAVISDPVFVAHFGKPKPHPEGKRQSIFGSDDQLKVAPKGVDKEHPDIDLLKCRSMAVVHSFTDEQVLNPNFKDELKRVAGILAPFVHCLNDMMTLPDDDDDDDSDDDQDQNQDEDEEADDAQEESSS